MFSLAVFSRNMVHVVTVALGSLVHTVSPLFHLSCHMMLQMPGDDDSGGVRSECVCRRGEGVCRRDHFNCVLIETIS